MCSNYFELAVAFGQVAVIAEFDSGFVDVHLVMSHIAFVAVLAPMFDQTTCRAEFEFVAIAEFAAESFESAEVVAVII